MNRIEFINNQSIDGKWFMHIKRLAPPPLLSSLQIQNEREAFQKFIETRKNPVFRYNVIDIDRVQTNIRELHTLRERIIQEEPNKSIAFLYKQKISEMLLQLDLILAFANNDRSQHLDLNFKLFGSFNTQLTSKVMDYITERDVNALDVSDRAFKKVASKVHLNRVYQLPADSLCNADQTAEIWNNWLGSDVPRWQCIVSGKHHLIKTDSRKKIVHIPHTLSLKSIKVLSLYEHEVGVHVMRREHGRWNKLQLLSVGTSNYQKAEEGMALLFEQTVLGKKQLRGVDKYYSLLVALGEIDGKPKDFAETFAILHEYFYKRFCKKTDEKTARTRSDKYAWRNCCRVFRGSRDCKAGTYFLRGKIYLEGNYQVCTFLTNNEFDYDTFMVGKYDITDAQTVEILQKLGALQPIKLQN